MIAFNLASANGVVMPSINPQKAVDCRIYPDGDRQIPRMRICDACTGGAEGLRTGAQGM